MTSPDVSAFDAGNLQIGWCGMLASSFHRLLQAVPHNERRCDQGTLGEKLTTGLLFHGL